MKILFLCTAHNSLSQRLHLALSRTHHVSIEYAISDEVMISAVALFQPHIVLCPFMTAPVPKNIYESILTLIIHPGPPGDAGPSALDWVLMGDDGSIDDSNQLLQRLHADDCSPGRTHWAVSVLQAIRELDAGPIWAFEEFEIDIDRPSLTKSELYRGVLTQAATTATLAAIARIQKAMINSGADKSRSCPAFPPTLQPESKYKLLGVSTTLPFRGGKLHHRPLLRASQREFDLSQHTAQQISRRIRSGDSQPGVRSRIFGISLYLYGGIIDENVDRRLLKLTGKLRTPILGFRNDAICISTCDGKGVWITQIRQPKAKADSALEPKVPAVTGLIQLGLLTTAEILSLSWPIAQDWQRAATWTFQEVWVDMHVDEKRGKTAYLYFNFYNGAMSTSQCSHLIEAMEFIIRNHTSESPIRAVIMAGGSYFSNGIALNIIEAAKDPAMESWLNINRINDVVYHLLHEFPSRGIITIAAIRGNASAGGVALAAACDIVIAGAEVVLCPAYRAIGLYGSEYHTLSYYGRCGETNGTAILHSMTPMSPLQAQSIGLVDYVFPGSGAVLDDYICSHIAYLLGPGILKRGLWKSNLDLSPIALLRARVNELAEMSLDFWSARSVRYHSRRFAFIRKVKPLRTPLRFANHRRTLSRVSPDEEETSDYDSVEHFTRVAQEKLLASLHTRLASEVSTTISKQNHSVAQQTSAAFVVEPAKHNQASGGKFGLIFPCYYEPSDQDLLTFPASQLSPGSCTVDNVTSWHDHPRFGLQNIAAIGGTGQY